MRLKQSLTYSLLITGLGALFFIPFLGGVHLFDWDEVNFAEIAREMMITGEYTRVYVDFLPFYQKPPLFFWLQVISMKGFGVNEFAARLPNAICGIVTLVLLYNLGRKLYTHRFGLIWSGLYFGSILPFLYFKSGIIDPWFNLFIFLGLYFFILFYWKKEAFEHIRLRLGKWQYLFIGGLFIGLGILTKGQVAYLIAILTLGVYWIYQRFRLYVSIPQFLFYSLSAALVTLTWYGLESWKNGFEFIREFNIYQYRLFSTPDAGHKGFPGYHFVVLLMGCFPASIFAIRSFLKMPAEEHAFQRDFRKWMKILFWVVLILFTIVKSKIVHYSSMTYFPLTFLAALVIKNILSGNINFSRWIKAGLWSIGGLFVFATLVAPFVGRNIHLIKPLFSKDPFAMANLEAEVIWTGWEIIPGLFLLAVLLYALTNIVKINLERRFIALFGGTAVFLMLTLIFYIGRIEGYSQRAAIEFIKEKSGEDCYIIPHGYKTYTHYFYGQKKPPNNKKSHEKDWLLHSPEVDKDVYVITKIHKAHQLREIPDLKEVGSKNGFVFFIRPVKD